MKTKIWDRQSEAGPTQPALAARWSRPTTAALRDRLVGFVWLLVATIDAWIGLRILLRAIGANPENPFAQIVYGPTALALEPFQGLTRNPQVDGMVLETTSLIALLAVGLAGWILVQLIDVVLLPAD